MASAFSFLAPKLGELINRHPDLRIQLVPVPRFLLAFRKRSGHCHYVEQPSQGRLVCSRLTDYTLGLYASVAILPRMAGRRTSRDLREHARIGYVEDLIFSPSLNYTGEIMRNWDARFEISSAIGQTEADAPAQALEFCMIYIARQVPELGRVLPAASIRRAPIGRITTKACAISCAFAQLSPSFRKSSARTAMSLLWRMGKAHHEKMPGSSDGPGTET